MNDVQKDLTGQSSSTGFVLKKAILEMNEEAFFSSAGSARKMTI